MNGEEAVAWVEKYRGLVMNKIRLLKSNTPYDLEDFLHDAYEAALMALRISSRKGISFPPVFWVIFRRNVLRVTPCFREKNRSDVSMSVFDCQSYNDEVYYGGDAYLPDPEEFLIGEEAERNGINILIPLAEQFMPVERQVFFCICGIYGGMMSQAETALYLGMSKGAVHQSCRRIMGKAVRFREDCLSAGLRLQREGSKVMKPDDDLFPQLIPSDKAGLQEAT